MDSELGRTHSCAAPMVASYASVPPPSAAPAAAAPAQPSHTVLAKPFYSTTPDSYNFAFMPSTSIPASNGVAPPDVNLLKQIDERLESLRAEIAAYDKSLLPARPRSAPAHSQSHQSASQQSATEGGKCMWPSFQTRQTRAAATAAAAAAKRAKDRGESQPGRGGVTYRGKASPRPRPPPPGTRPLGYQLLSKYTSTPAYGFRAKIVLSRDVDPLLPDDGPGPADYDTLKY